MYLLSINFCISCFPTFRDKFIKCALCWYINFDNKMIIYTFLWTVFVVQYVCSEKISYNLKSYKAQRKLFYYTNFANR